MIFFYLIFTLYKDQEFFIIFAVYKMLQLSFKSRVSHSQGQKCLFMASRLYMLHCNHRVKEEKLITARKQKKKKKILLFSNLL